MGRRARTILADSNGLESKKISRSGRGIFLDFPFYRTWGENSKTHFYKDPMEL